MPLIVHTYPRDLSIRTRVHTYFRIEKIQGQTMFEHLDRMYDGFVALSSAPGRRAIITEYGAIHALFRSLPLLHRNILRNDFHSGTFTDYHHFIHRIEIIEGTRFFYQNINSTRWDFRVIRHIIREKKCYFFTKRFGLPLSNCVLPY